MGKDLVLYQSKYGASRSYAEWLGAAWGCTAAIRPSSMVTSTPAVTGGMLHSPW